MQLFLRARFYLCVYGSSFSQAREWHAVVVVVPWCMVLPLSLWSLRLSFSQAKEWHAVAGEACPKPLAAEVPRGTRIACWRSRGALGTNGGFLRLKASCFLCSRGTLCQRAPPDPRPPAATPALGRGWTHYSPWALAVLLRALPGRGLGSRAGALPLLWGPGLVSVGRPPPPYRCTKARSVMLCGGLPDPKSGPQA